VHKNCIIARLPRPARGRLRLNLPWSVLRVRLSDRSPADVMISALASPRRPCLVFVFSHLPTYTLAIPSTIPQIFVAAPHSFSALQGLHRIAAFPLLTHVWPGPSPLSRPLRTRNESTTHPPSLNHAPHFSLPSRICRTSLARVCYVSALSEPSFIYVSVFLVASILSLCWPNRREGWCRLRLLVSIAILSWLAWLFHAARRYSIPYYCHE